ncbi:hypothetical protein KC19_6G000200 [Ceratodon purpureus]|uniref:Peptidase S54 rhomboid domain-containing protein n=1 Tax=Ceratodon purpureus TaxID=3225 RepID=A0A8T0H9S2_CERPU|nr:hypothetical protein KC19_6G000200 [Ceratodon purpureus]
MGCGAMGMGGLFPSPAWMAALGGMMAAQGGLRTSGAPASARFPADMPSTAMVVSATRSGFLIAGALQLHHWAALTSNFIDQFQEHSSRSPQRQQVTGMIGESYLEVPLEVNQGCQILSKTGAQLLGAGISLYTPWNSIIGFVDGKTTSRRRNIVATAASTGGEDGSSSASSRSTGYGIGSGSRMWTNIILGVNLLVFGAQIASQGQLLLLGAKVNSLIDKGQWWRLVTPSLLHANIMHLLVNCYSLNSVGPTVESLGGGKRFLAVYAVSALTSSGLSYTLCTAPSVGASGAIFGLVGALAVFLARHKTLMIGGDRSLAQVGRVIAINLGFGLLSSGIDNWGHVGGLLGGAALAWLLGPAFSFESAPEVGKKFLLDRPPIAKLFSPWSEQKGDR